MLYITPIYSQVSIGISGGTDILSINLSNNQNYLDSYWHKGINIGVDGEYFLSTTISINGAFEYVYYKFDHYSFDEPHVPETGLISSYGKDSKALGISGNIRFYTNPDYLFHVFFTTGLGFIYEDFGKITATFDDLNFGQFTNEIKFKSEQRFVHIVGLGARINLMHDLAIDVCGSYYSDYTDFLNTKVDIGLVYLLNK